MGFRADRVVQVRSAAEARIPARPAGGRRHASRAGLALLRTVGLAVLLGAGGAAAGERPARANYLLRCSGCHLGDGSGLPASGIPPLPGFIDIFAGDEDGRTYLTHVPGVAASGLSDAEVAAVLNYVVGEWGDPSAVAPFNGAEVTARRAVPVLDVVAYRRALTARLRAEGVVLAEYPWP